MESNKVTNDNWLGSLLLLKSRTIYLKEVNPSSFFVFMFGGCGGLGSFVPSCGCGGLGSFVPSCGIFIVSRFHLNYSVAI
jgi:hypothetical protein